MGRITVNSTKIQFSCKLSWSLDLWNPRESRLNGKSQEAVESNKKIEKILLDIHSAFDSLVERKKPFDAEAVKNLFQGNMGAQITLLALLTQHIEELEAHVGIDVAPTTLSTYVYTHRSLGKFIQKKFKTKDVAFGQLNEQFIREYQNSVLGEQGYAMQTVRLCLAFKKKSARLLSKKEFQRNFILPITNYPNKKKRLPKL